MNKKIEGNPGGMFVEVPPEKTFFLKSKGRNKKAKMTKADQVSHIMYKKVDENGKRLSMPVWQVKYATNNCVEDLHDHMWLAKKISEKFLNTIKHATSDKFVQVMKQIYL